MSFPINHLRGSMPALPMPPAIGGASAANGAGPTGQAVGGSFQDHLVNSLQQVNSMQMEANRAVENMAGGGDVNPAEVLTAVQKADLAFRMTMQIRNKLVQA